MATKKTQEDNYSTTAISNKLEGLFELQAVDSQIDKIQVLRGELPLEVEDLEAEIEKLNEHLENQSNIDEDLNNSVSEQQQKIKDAELLIEKYTKLTLS